MKNNKGFSLVELIIVIAIMAILVGVLAPQLIKYIEKTNVSSDQQLCDSVRTALVTASLDPDVVKAGADIADSTGSTVSTISANSARTAAEEILGMGLGDVDKQIKSKKAKNSGSGTVSYKKSGNQIQVYCTADTTIYAGYYK